MQDDKIAIASCAAPVPGNISIVGWEGNELTEYFDPPPSSLVMPIAKMVRAGWDILRRRIAALHESVRPLKLPFVFKPPESARRDPS